MTNTGIKTNQPEWIGKTQTITIPDKKSRKSRAAAPKMDNYSAITAAIIGQMEQGIIPWRKPWHGPSATRNYFTDRPYSFVNQMILRKSGRYATFKQWTEAGARIRKGAKAEYIYFYTVQPKATGELGDDGEEIILNIPVLRKYGVFHESDVEGIELKPADYTAPEKVAAAEKIIADYTKNSGVDFYTGVGDRAYYSPRVDAVKIPDISQFANSSNYYATAFHELGHSTGHFSRLNREGVNGAGYHAFGDEVYSREELVAEITSAYLCNYAGVETSVTFRNTAAYLQSWLAALKNDKNMIMFAAGKAEKAAEYILSMLESEQPDPTDDHTENTDAEETTAPETTAEISADVSDAVKNESLNPMCHNCTNTECSGTTSRYYTGCALKTTKKSEIVSEKYTAAFTDINPMESMPIINTEWSADVLEKLLIKFKTEYRKNSEKAEHFRDDAEKFIRTDEEINRLKKNKVKVKPYSMIMVTWKLYKDIYDYYKYYLDNAEKYQNIIEELENITKKNLSNSYETVKPTVALPVNSAPSSIEPKKTATHKSSVKKQESVPEIIESAVVQTANDTVISIKNAVVTFSGALNRWSRAEAQRKVEAAGGKAASSVTKNTTILVVGHYDNFNATKLDKSEKVIKAERLNQKGCNIKIISEAAFIKLMEAC